MQYGRTDAGIEVDLKVEFVHAAVGTIRYGGDAPDGMLLYLKASLVARETEDVRSYRAQNEQTRKFPHEPTTQQFFKEGQFESYRALGYQIADELLTAGWVQARVPDFRKWLTTVANTLEQEASR